MKQRLWKWFSVNLQKKKKEEETGDKKVEGEEFAELVCRVSMKQKCQKPGNGKYIFNTSSFNIFPIVSLILYQYKHYKQISLNSCGIHCCIANCISSSVPCLLQFSLSLFLSFRIVAEFYRCISLCTFRNWKNIKLLKGCIGFHSAHFTLTMLVQIVLD